MQTDRAMRRSMAIHRLNILLLLGSLCLVSCGYYAQQRQIQLLERDLREDNAGWSYYTGDLEERIGLQQDQIDKDERALTMDNVEILQSRKTSDMWEAAARDMSREADRRNLDRSFPRVYDSEETERRARNVVSQLEHYRIGIRSRRGLRWQPM